jgi:hypothetical protein
MWKTLFLCAKVLADHNFLNCVQQLNHYRNDQFAMFLIEFLKANSYPQKEGTTYSHMAKVVDKRQQISPASVHNLSPQSVFWGYP